MSDYGFDGSYGTEGSSYGYEEYTSEYSPVARPVDTGKVITKSFLFMFVALVITAFASLTTSPMTAVRMMNGGSFFILLIAELGIVFASNAALRKNNVVLGGILYTVYSFITGMTLSVIYVVYTGSSIASTFLITAVMFGSFAVVGLVTKKDLTKIGSLCIMGLWGIIISGIVNVFFIRSNGFDLIVSVIAIVIFVGLTAYDMQKIKNMCAYSEVESENALAMMGAFEIYLDFINLFLRLLRLFGKRK